MRVRNKIIAASIAFFLVVLMIILYAGLSHSRFGFYYEKITYPIFWIYYSWSNGEASSLNNDSLQFFAIIFIQWVYIVFLIYLVHCIFNKIYKRR